MQILYKKLIYSYLHYREFNFQFDVLYLAMTNVSVKSVLSGFPVIHERKQMFTHIRV